MFGLLIRNKDLLFPDVRNRCSEQTFGSRLGAQPPLGSTFNMCGVKTAEIMITIEIKIAIDYEPPLFLLRLQRGSKGHSRMAPNLKVCSEHPETAGLYFLLRVRT